MPARPGRPKSRSSDVRFFVPRTNVINKGSSKRKYGRVYESSLYGTGEGSSLTDYAIAGRSEILTGLRVLEYLRMVKNIL